MKNIIKSEPKSWNRNPTMGERLLYRRSPTPSRGKDYYIASFQVNYWGKAAIKHVQNYIR